MSDLIKCARCKICGQQTDFPWKANLQYLKTCAPCTRKRNDNAAEKRRLNSNKENVPPPKRRRVLGRDKTGDGLPTTSWDAFILLLQSNRDGGFEVHSIVTMGDDAPNVNGTEDRAHAFAASCISPSGLLQDSGSSKSSIPLVHISFNENMVPAYKMKRELTQTGAVTYTFYCAQLEGEQTKNKLTETGSRRACMTMDRFKCSGWLFVMLDAEDLSTAGIRMTHYRPHTPYTDISLSDDIIKEIERLKDLTAAKVRVI